MKDPEILALTQIYHCWNCQRANKPYLCRVSIEKFHKDGLTMRLRHKCKCRPYPPGIAQALRVLARKVRYGYKEGLPNDNRTPDTMRSVESSGTHGSVSEQSVGSRVDSSRTLRDGGNS